MPISSNNDKYTVADARNLLRKNIFFHKEYEPNLDDPLKKLISQKIYTINSEERQRYGEKSINDFLLKQDFAFS